jgi:geranylgeranyl reductase
MYDVAIIGAGPAGSTLARLIGRHMRVLLVDKRPLEGPAQEPCQRKCCGGLLAPDAQQMLSRFGLGLPREVLVGPQIFVVRAIDLERQSERCYQRYYINMDRERFDRWLLSLVPAGVEVRTNCRFHSFKPTEHGVAVELQHGGQVTAEEARILIGADGAASRVRRQLLPDFGQAMQYAAVQERVEGDAGMPFFSAVFDSRLTDYYCWTIPKENELLIGGAFPNKSDAMARFTTFKQRLAEHGVSYGRMLGREGTVIMRPAAGRHMTTGCGDVLLIGEAGGWISPSSSEGISYAFHSAMHMADALLTAEPERVAAAYRSKMRGLRANILLKILKSHVVFTPFLRRLVMRSGLQSIAVRKGASAKPEP